MKRIKLFRLMTCNPYEQLREMFNSRILKGTMDIKQHSNNLVNFHFIYE